MINNITIKEAQHRLSHSIASYNALEQAAQALLSTIKPSVFLVGGLAHDNQFIQEYWTDGQQSFWIISQRHNINDCGLRSKILSHSLNSNLATGLTPADAIIVATLQANCAQRAQPYDDIRPIQQIDLPYLSSTPLLGLPPTFQPYQQIGLYPIVDSSTWIKKLLPLGIQTIQLRIKESCSNVADEIKTSIQLARSYGATLFINDYWQLAIEYQADGVHLGQSDLDTADIASIHQAGLLLGISTHCYSEVARAHAYHPSYIACGPIYATTSKVMSFAPQGIAALCAWRKLLNYPLVAIGGITDKRIHEVLQTGVNGVALISAITHAADPIQQTKELLGKV